MIEDLTKRYYEQLLPAYNEFVAEQRNNTAGQSKDIRLATSAAIALYHFREHIPEQYRKELKNYIEQCLDYGILRDVVNSLKHSKLTKKHDYVSSADDIYELLIDVEYKDEQGPYRHIFKSVTIRLKDGSRRDMLEVLTNVLNMWGHELIKLGITKKPKPIKLQDRFSPPLRQINNMKLIMTRGLKYKQVFSCYRYNYHTRALDQRISDGTKFEYKITPQLPHEATLELINEKTGKSIKHSLTLSARESYEFGILESNDKRGQYLIEYAKRIGLLDKLQNKLAEPDTDKSN